MPEVDLAVAAPARHDGVDPRAPARPDRARSHRDRPALRSRRRRGARHRRRDSRRGRGAAPAPSSSQRRSSRRIPPRSPHSSAGSTDERCACSRAGTASRPRCPPPAPCGSFRAMPRPLLVDRIAGVPVRDLVRDFGTPTYVYDAATIAAERIARPAPLRRRPLRPEGLLEPGDARPGAPPRRAGRRGQRRRDPPGAGGRLPRRRAIRRRSSTPPTSSTARRSSSCVRDTASTSTAARPT